MPTRRRFLFDFLPVHSKHICKAAQGRPANQSLAKELAFPSLTFVLITFIRIIYENEIRFSIFGQIKSKSFEPKEMLSIGEQIRKLREDQGLPLRKVAAELDIDQSILSKIERGERKASKEQIIQIARIFKVDEKELLINYLSDCVLYDLKDEDLATDALKVAEKKIKYMTKNQNGT